MPDIQQLYQLQQIDSNIHTARKFLRKISVGLVESESLISARTAFQEAEKVYKHAKTLMTQLDLEVKSLRQKIERSEKRLYGGKLPPKEAVSVQQKIDSSKRWLDKREDDLLEAMIAVEESEAEYQTCQETLTKIDAGWQTEQADLLREQDEHNQKIDVFRDDRESLELFIAEDELVVYEKLRSKKGGTAIAVVENGLCLACGVMLPNRLVQLALNDDSFHFCESCGRIIHIL
ncbi:MAG: hypothetical protein B6242_17345 [Anaerolineaceae bacterium 4572_78]|nr:MAG: hypothetical protein B6242_17345 [Anaerolineaceae bacterium 4572_78]